mmetsp:Transcript_3202/g.3122  ORF Transcript_3202/g.3122 Transcript_3202/m.3122 type:complete len:89 (-) Transcript_3202:1228-1494(-)
MSIYGGFGTRNLEQSYCKSLYNALYLLQLKISKNNRQEQFDENRFRQLFNKLYSKLFLMEDQKYLPPKYSYALRDLAMDFGIFEKVEN